MLEFPSPPEDSARIPGIVRKISAVVLGAALIISFIFNVEIDVEVLIDALGFALPVITTSSIDLVLRESCSCANIIAPIERAVTVNSFL